MAIYIEYLLEDGTVLLVEANEAQGKVTKATNIGGNIVLKSEKKFKDAFESIKSSAKILRGELSELQADEVAVSFGLKTVGEVGLFAICKVGGEMNYEVTLKWTKKEQQNKQTNNT